jgi:hypothetical protein
MVLVLALYEPPSNVVPRNEGWTACKRLATAQLKAPSSATFSWGPTSSHYDDAAGTGTLAGYVDAENSFGAKIRNTFIYDLRREGQYWIPKSVVFANR